MFINIKNIFTITLNLLSEVYFQVEHTMLSLLSGETREEPAAYIDLIMEEPPVKEDPAILPQDCVLLAVEEGTFRYVFLCFFLIKKALYYCGVCIEIVR